MSALSERLEIYRRDGQVRLVAAAHPLKVELLDLAVPQGLTLAEMLRLAQPDPMLLRDAVIYVGDQEVPRELWHRVRPHAGAQVTARVVPHLRGGGGGGGGGKNVARVVLMIAVVVAAIYLGPIIGPGVVGAGAVEAGTGAVAAGALGISAATAGTIATGVIGMAGMMAVNALIPPQLPSGGRRESPSKFIEGARNTGRAFQPIPLVLGRYRYAPPYGARPFTEVVGDTNRLRVLFVWGYGELEISDLQIGGTALEEFDDFELETVPGTSADPDLTLYSNQVDQQSVAAKLTQAGGWLVRTASADADELSIDIGFPQGLKFASGTTGDQEALDVTVEVEFSPTGAEAWQQIKAGDITNVTFPRGWLDTNADSGARAISVTAPAGFHLLKVAGNFVEDGFAPGMTITTSGFEEAANNGTFTIATVAPKAITVVEGGLVDEDHGRDREESRGLSFANSQGGQRIEEVVVDPGVREITFTYKRTTQIRDSISWRVPRGHYDVRIRRTTQDRSSSKHSIMDETWWLALRRVTNESPVAFRRPLAQTAMMIRATDQLNGTLDELTGVAQTVCLDWDSGSGTWIKRTTSNPASLYRYVLQGPGNGAPIPDARLDLDTLQAWHEFCAGKGFEYNAVHDTNESVWEVLKKVAAAGRASPIQRDGKWSVVIDQPQAVPVTHITPRNSWGFEAEKAFLDAPHAWRIAFANAAEGWKQDEITVYRDGFTAATATLFERIDMPGVTDADQAWKLGRYFIAAGIARPERWTINQDFESVVVRRGDRVLLTHDVLLIGTAAGRIKSVTTDGGGNVTGIAVDEALTMEAGKSYAISIRTPANAQAVTKVTTVAGEQTAITFATPIDAAAGVAAGDLFGFGEWGSETEDALVLSVEPGPDFTARLVLVPYRAAIYDADAGPIPPYVPKITPLTPIPEVDVTRVRTDESALRRAGDALIERAAIAFRRPLDLVDLAIEVQGRPSETGEPWRPMPVDERSEGEIIVLGVTQGEDWDFRLRWNSRNRLLPGPWTPIYNNRIVGKSTPPAPLEELTISVFGGSALLRWDEPAEIDVRFGGRVVFRHSPAFAGALWAESSSIGQAATARSLQAVLPLKPGTYLARVFDADDNPGDVVSVTTKQASVLAFAAVDSLDEGPSFAGAHAGTIAASGVLQLEPAGDFDAMADFDEVSSVDFVGGSSLAGTYDFAAGFDLGVVKRVRLTSRIAAASVNLLDRLDDHAENIDDWEDFDGTLQAQADITVWVRITDDDPSGTPSWGEWQRLDSAEFEARGFDFQARLTSNDPAFNILVTDLGIDVEEVA